MSASTNLFRQLRGLLGPPSTYIAEVIEVYSDDSSLVRLLGPEGLTAYAGNVATGTLSRVRGSTVPAGSRAFVRAGVIESQAPSGEIGDIEVGRIVAVQE